MDWKQVLVATASPLQDKSQQRVLIRAAETVKYDVFMALTQRLNSAGWSKVGLINESVPS